MIGKRRGPSSGSEDQELIGRILTGDAGAEEELVGRFRGLAIGLARGRFGLDPLVANEVWQDVVLKLWAHGHKALRNWRGEGRFSTYLTVIVVNQCIRLQTARSRQETAAEPLDAAQHIPDTTPGPDATAAEGERRRALQAAMSELSPRDQLLLTLRFGDGHEPTEIATLLRQSPGTVRKALFDARKRLRQRLLASDPELFSDPSGNGDAPTRSHSSGGSE